MGIEKFIERYNKMPKFLALISLSFFMIFKPKKFDRLTRILQKKKERQEADMVQKVKKMTADLRSLNAELKGSTG